MTSDKFEEQAVYQAIVKGRRVDYRDDKIIRGYARAVVSMMGKRYRLTKCNGQTVVVEVNGYVDAAQLPIRNSHYLVLRCREVETGVEYPVAIHDLKPIREVPQC